MRVALVGCGNIGLRRHLPALQATDDVTIAALADPTVEHLAEAQRVAGLADADCHLDWHDVILRPDVDGIVIATPQRFRPEIAIAAARAGKHLLCEKPLALAPAEAQAMVDAARVHGVILATVHNYMVVPVFRALKEQVDTGIIGEIETVILNFLGVEDKPGADGYRPRWRHDVSEAGGGVLMDMLHAVYLAGWFFGADPVGVSATVDQRLPDSGDVEDYALVRFDYPRGHALINMAWGMGPGGVELMGTRGRIVLTTAGFGTLPFAAPDRVHIVTPDGSEVVPAEHDFGASFELIVRDWVAAIAAGRQAMAPGEAGVAVLSAVVGAYESAAIGREVALPLAESDPVYRLGAPGVAQLALPLESTVRRRGLFGSPRQPAV